MMDYADDSFCILPQNRIETLTPDPLPEECADFEIPQHSGRGRKAIVLKPGQFLFLTFSAEILTVAPCGRSLRMTVWEVAQK
jgi:hypothetical protein